MEAITEKVCGESRNAWGGYVVVCRQRFAIGVGDIGKTRPNYLGHGHREYTFERSDAGRIIEVLTDKTSNWTCWSFASTQGAE